MNSISNLLLVYPDGFSGCYDTLKPFYLALYELIPDDIQLHIVVNNERAQGELARKINRPFNPILVNGFDEIWLRDFMGFVTEKEVVKPIFNPTYLSTVNTQEKNQRVNNNSKQLLRQLNLPFAEIDLVWDGGNLVSNGRIGFITDKILTDNPDYSEAEILSRIEYTLQIKPVLLPKCFNDTLGHMDGYMSFLDEQTICISAYPDKDYLKHENEYMFRLREAAREEKLKIVDIHDYPTIERCNVGGESIESAKGSYINFLKLNNTIILPKFDIGRIISSRYNAVNQETLKEMGYDVRIIDCTDLSSLGGVLHCISWEW